MARKMTNEAEREGSGVPEWVWEVLLVITITPALVYAFIPPLTLPVA